MAGQSFDRQGAVLVLAVRNPANPSKTLCLFVTDLGREAALDAARRLRYFTDSSWLVFTSDGRAEKGTFKGEQILGPTSNDTMTLSAENKQGGRSMLRRSITAITLALTLALAGAGYASAAEGQPAALDSRLKTSGAFLKAAAKITAETPSKRQSPY